MLFRSERVEVFCHHKTIITREMESITVSEGLDNLRTTEAMHQITKEERWGYAQEDRAFVDAIMNDEPVPVTAIDGYKSVELVNACYESVRTGQRVSFNVG